MIRKLYQPGAASLTVSFFLLTAFVPGIRAFAQQGDMSGGRSWKFEAAPGISRITVNDAYFGAVSYKDHALNAALIVSTEGDRAYHGLELSFNSGTLNATEGNSLVRQRRFDASYTYLYKTEERASGFRLRPGAALNALYVRRDFDNFINNNQSFDFVASVSLAMDAMYLFSPQNGWSLSDRFYLPVLSLVDQTAFGTESTSIGVDPAIKSFSSFFRIMNRLEIQKQVSGQHAVSLGYGWDFYRINSLREVRQATHTLALKYSLTF